MTHVLALALGVLGWSFTEYIMHNFNGHQMRGKTDFSREHLAHHADSAYFAATSKKVAYALPLMLLMAALGWWLVGVNGLLFTVGFAAFYTCYEVLHRRIHTHAPLNAYGEWARKHHFLHHHLDPNSNHGVTSPIWDLVFRTHKPAPTVRIPRKHAPVWMMDADGQVLPRWAAVYTVKQRRKRA